MIRTAKDVQELLYGSLTRADRPFIVQSEHGTDAPQRLLISPEDSEQVWVITVTGPYDRSAEQVARLAVDVDLAEGSADATPSGEVQRTRAVAPQEGHARLMSPPAAATATSAVNRQP